MDNYRKLLNASGTRGATGGSFKGVTLVEMAIVLAISTILVMTFYSFLSTHMMSAAEESSEIRVQADIRTTIQELTQELDGSKLYYLDPLGCFICYQTPQLGPNGSSFLLDTSSSNLGNPIYGAYGPDGTFLKGGYYKIYFEDHKGANDILIEDLITNSINVTGQNVSGTLGSTSTSVLYNKGYIFGHFEIQCYSQADPAPQLSIANSVVKTFPETVNGVSKTRYQFSGPEGTPVGLPRMISGKVLRQLDTSDPAADTAAATGAFVRTHPWGGGFFYMRQPNAKKVLNSTGTGPGSGAATDTNPQISGLNGGTFAEEADCDSFVDKNYNNLYDSTDNTTLIGVPWKGSLKVQIRSFDPKNMISASPDLRDKYSQLRTAITRIKVRN